MKPFPKAKQQGKLFSIEGRKGQWRLLRGNCRPTRDKPATANHAIASYETKKQNRVREFIRVRCYSRVDDQIFLDRISAGYLRCDAETGKVFSCLGSRGSVVDWFEIKTETNKRGYQFIRIYRGSSRRKISVHRLQIMADIEGFIPDGFDVDHRNKDVSDNRLCNLRLRDTAANRSSRLECSKS